MVYGFIGTGTITEAMIDGLMKSGLSASSTVVVSPRSASVSGRLAARYDKVTVALCNQDVVDACDVLVLAVRWQVAESVMRELVIPYDTKVISVIAAISNETLAQWTGISVERFVRAIPLPFVARREGVTAIYPPDLAASTLFDAMGVAIGCETKAEFDLLAVASALMGTYFGVLEQAAQWMESKGMAPGTAQRYLKPLFASLGHFAHDIENVDFSILRREFSTEGGLNEQVFQDFISHGGSRALQVALDNVLGKIKGQSAAEQRS